MKKYILSTWLVLLLLPFAGWGNNIRVDSVRYNMTSVNSGQPLLKMWVTVTWENSWRDDYNYDAAYVFFKFKRKETSTKVAQPWNHLYLFHEGHQVVGGNGQYDFWLCPLSSEGTKYNTGLYIYRKENGIFPKDSVQLEVTWDITKQMINPQLTYTDITNGKVQIVAHAIEMVYIPRGAYRIGDGVSTKGFRKLAFPIPAEDDIVSTNYLLTSSNNDSTARYAADRVNDNTQNLLSEWKGGTAPWWWSIDFGAGNNKRLTYWGVNAYKHQPTYYPTTFRLMGSLDPDGGNWVEVWKGSGRDNWMMAKDAYPIEKALPIDAKVYDNAAHPEYKDGFRAYRIEIDGMNAGYPIISSVGMTENDLEDSRDYSVLIDNPVTLKDSLRNLGAADGSVWWNSSVPASFPNGYAGFYAMKYEISQDQYARFLNKLTYAQQNGLLDNRLDLLQEGDYIFGNGHAPSCRNGIRIVTKMAGLPVTFACDYNTDDPSGQERDGQNVACNYMNIRDMLAYADWACLRPLSEMEYEKMSRPFFPYSPSRGEYAWGTRKLTAASHSDIAAMGTSMEAATQGNANYGGALGFPLRVGAFAKHTQSGIEESGAGFWGCMDLCGNLAEMCYNVNHQGITLLLPESYSGNVDVITSHATSHGDGLLGTNGAYNGNGSTTKRWSENPVCIALKGGSFASEGSLLRVSDRTWHTGYFANITDRDSTVTFRLGHSAPVLRELESWLITEEQQTTQGKHQSDFFLNTTTYTIKGNKPENPYGGLLNYIWYCSESGGEWKVMENQTNQNLYFDKYKNDTIGGNVNGLNFKFKRKVFSPFSDSQTSSEYVVSLVANPFESNLEMFQYTGNTHQVKCNWDASLPRQWAIKSGTPGITINENTGVLSGLTNTMCDVVVTLRCPLYDNMIYEKRVKEIRDWNYTGGQQSITLPPGTYQLECWGAEGGGRRLSGNGNSGLGGLGGYSVGNLTLTANTNIYIYVGGQGYSSNSGSAAGGWNGGGAGYASSAGEPGNGGGGGTDIRIVSNSVNHRIIVAGGGGGGGEDSGDSYGHGGGTSGNGYGTYDGTQTKAGNGGGFGYGAATNRGDGGGGGGGWYGGGTLSTTSVGSDTQGGGGGSGFIWTEATFSYPPSSYVKQTQYYLKKAKTISGGVAMPNPAGGSMTGKQGHGLVRITVL